jgi:hypothetical protein
MVLSFNRKKGPPRENISYFYVWGCGAQLASYPAGAGGSLSPGLKRQGREADHSLPVSDLVRKTWVCPSPSYACMA